MVKRHLHLNKQNKEMLMRNLVSQLITHEQIKTTVPKAKEASKFAERIITYGKRNSKQSLQLAKSFLINSKTSEVPLIDKLTNTLAQRYKDRNGGYTRIHLLGNRRGDNAPQAILEFVDNKRDLKTEILAMTIARESSLRKFNWDPSKSSLLRHYTQLNLNKCLRYKSSQEQAAFHEKVLDIQDRLLAESQLGLSSIDLDNKPPQDTKTLTWATKGKNVFAGERTVGMSKKEGSPISIAKGIFRKLQRPPSNKLVTN